MKKSIITTFLLVFTNLLFANEYEIKTVQEYNNDKNLISIRPSEKVVPQDDETGNRLFINDNGDFFIYNWDKLTTFNLADKTHLPEKEYKYDLSDLPCLYGLHRVSSDYLYYSWTYTSYLAVNIKTGKRKFQVSINDIFWDDFVYYDESTDILFFRDSNKAMHSIVHPGMNDEEIESIAIHPSGDIYILRINWQTNKHTLYCIENTWDPQWREQWYKEHQKN
ncbi:hypothetical protein SAMN04487977_102388 [Treponema bryantii]|uniref:DUF5050 domain-containing protein n=1 Tax=Treponema bryantii TaxID=163 RepID=A0A1H9D2R3_9SPIR|nr:hypothetical protein [Treponema bryantii]SEQ07123.1 hypothetical protein SAMN04487977_102388 [Treponema bryantii]